MIPTFGIAAIAVFSVAFLSIIGLCLLYRHNAKYKIQRYNTLE